MNTILIVEDDQDINHMLTDLLVMNHYQVKNVYDGSTALETPLEDVDLILLDLMLPGINGKELILHLKRKKDLPIIILSALGDIETKVLLFDLGADDYITKPFNNQELIARIKTRLKHTTNKVYKYKELTLDEEHFHVTCKNEFVYLSKTEFQLLKILIAHPTQVFSKNDLIEQVWSHEDSADDNTLNVHISNIRHKLKKVNPTYSYIKTIWNIGYKLENEKS